MSFYIIIAIIAYCIGSINFSVILSKKLAGFDIRQKGSGNAGSTNMLRSAGKKAAILTLICDILKGVIAIGIAILIGNIFSVTDKALLVQIAGIAVVVGHTYPMFLGFKGGKGVATSLGVIIIANWQIGLICLVFALILMVITRMVSVGSIAAAILFPVLVIFIGQNYIVPVNNWSYLIFSIIVAILVLFNHRENLKRIFTGKENKISFKKSSNLK